MSLTNHQQRSTTLAILAGGKATRLGGLNKALIQIDGETIISKIHRTLIPFCNETIIISNQKTDYGIIAKVYPDIIENCGPLGGIHSALEHASNNDVLIVSSDMPFINSNIVKKLKEEYLNQPEADIIIPTLKGLNEPLLAIYSKKLADKISHILSDRKGHRITELLNQCNTIYLEIEATPENVKSFTNINTFEDVDDAKGKIQHT